MKKKIRPAGPCLTFALLIFSSVVESAENVTPVATGRVFHDANGNGRFDETDRP